MRRNTAITTSAAWETLVRVHAVDLRSGIYRCPCDVFAGLMAELSDVSVALKRVGSVGLAQGGPQRFCPKNHR